MTVGTVLGILAIGSGVGLWALAELVDRRRRKAPRPGLPATSAAPTLVLLPCRDEEANVLPCLDSLLGQTAAPQIRVIDDASTDRTAELVATRFPTGRVELVTAGPLPPGWPGKVHALHCGLAGVTEPWLLSTDADTRHAPEALARAHATACEFGLDLVSFSGHQLAATLGEALITPSVFALLDALVADWSALANNQGAALANGQFILIRRSALEAIGGFAAIRNAAIDDVALARALRAGGFRTGLLRAPDILGVRMYRGFGESFRGWRRNLGAIFADRPALTAAILGGLLALPCLAIGALATGQPWAALAAWATGAAASARLRHGSGHGAWVGLLYPLDAGLLGMILLLGSRDRRRGRLQRWKGREMSVD